IIVSVPGSASVSRSGSVIGLVVSRRVIITSTSGLVSLVVPFVILESSMTISDKMAFLSTIITGGIGSSLLGSILILVRVIGRSRSRGSLFLSKIDTKLSNLFSKAFYSLVSIICIMVRGHN